MALLDGHICQRRSEIDHDSRGETLDVGNLEKIERDNGPSSFIHLASDISEQGNPIRDLVILALGRSDACAGLASGIPKSHQKPLGIARSAAELAERVVTYPSGRVADIARSGRAQPPISE